MQTDNESCSETVKETDRVFAVNKTRTHGIVKVKCWSGVFYFIKEFKTAKITDASSDYELIVNSLEQK